MKCTVCYGVSLAQKLPSPDLRTFVHRIDLFPCRPQTCNRLAGGTSAAAAQLLASDAGCLLPLADSLADFTAALLRLTGALLASCRFVARRHIVGVPVLV